MKYQHRLRAREKYESLRSTNCAPIGDKPRPTVKFDMDLETRRGSPRICPNLLPVGSEKTSASHGKGQKKKKKWRGTDTQASVWRPVVPYVALASVARRRRGDVVRQMSTPGRGGGRRQGEYAAETRKVRQVTAIIVVRINKSKSRLNITHRIIAPRLQTATATAFGCSEHLDPALLSDGHLADLRHASSEPLTREIPLHVFWKQVSG